jgi:hypothetical protein
MNRAGFHIQVPKSAHFLPLLAAGFALLVFAVVAVSALPFAEGFETAYRDAPAAAEPPAEESQAASTASEPRSKARCKYCGIIESTRQIGGLHEVTVRLADQTTQVFSDASPGNWRPGERIILIGGGNSPRR